MTQVKHSYDAVIIGAGIIGCGIGFELSRRGVRTAVIEKNVGPGEGSTSASSAIIRFTYSTYSAVAMAYEGLRYWENWQDYLQNKNEETLWVSTHDTHANEKAHKIIGKYLLDYLQKEIF